MVWGSGSALGVLALLGYAVSVCGAVLLWANRIDVPVWVNDEFGAVRRSLCATRFLFRSTAYAKNLLVRLHLPISSGDLLATRAAALTRAPSFSALG
jgi:hypothetical protein